MAVNIGASVDLAEGQGTRAMPALATATADVIVFMAIAEDAIVANVTPTSSPTLTWTKRPDVGSSNRARVQIWTSSAVGVTSVTVTATPSVASGRNYRCRATAAGNVTGYGGTATAGTAQTASLARSGTDSAVFMAVGDWDTGAVGSPSWTPGGTTVASQQGSAATYIFGLWSNSGASGTASTGISSPTYSAPAFAGLEVLGGSSGLTGNVNRVTVTESARSVSHNKVHTTPRVTVTESARALARIKGVAVTRASETASARSASRHKAVPVARVATTDTARPAIRVKVYLANRAAEAASARVMGRIKIYPLTRTTEVSTAAALTASGSLMGNAGRVFVTEVARAVGRAKLTALARTLTTETARLVTSSKVRGLNRVVTTETARPALQFKSQTIIRVQETSSARTATAAKRKAIGNVLETSVARTLIATGPPPEGDDGQIWGVDMGLR